MSLRPTSRLAAIFPSFAAALPLGIVLAGCGATDGASAGGEPLGASSAGLTVCPSGSTVEGVDVSTYQGTVDWAKVKAAGVEFGIARISDGTGSIDPTFTTNWSGMKTAGLIRGAYQFFEPGEDPIAQANIVVQHVGALGPGDLPVTIDVEVTGGQSAATIVANIQKWVNVVAAGTGKTPMVYTSSGWWSSNVSSTAFGSTLDLWAANWGVTCPSIASGWAAWKVWQWTDSGSVSGISGNVDRDRFNGSLADLTAYANGGGAWGAKYVAQSFPLATTTLQMVAGESLPAWIQLKNVGTKAWDQSTRIATTQPRDRASVFVANDWISASRPSEVATGTVPPGGTYQFDFTLHAPATPGTYDEFWGVVEDGTAWFSDPGQLGPPDDQLEVKIQVVAADAGAGGSGGAAGSGGSAGAGGAAGGAIIGAAVFRAVFLLRRSSRT